MTTFLPYQLIRMRPNGTEDVQLSDEDRDTVIDSGERMAVRFPQEQYKVFERMQSSQHAVARRIVWPYKSLTWTLE